MRHPPSPDDSARRAAVQRALRAAAAVTTTALFAIGPAGCAVTVTSAAEPGAGEGDHPADAHAPGDAAAAADAALAADAPPHPPADGHTVAMGDAGPAADGPEDACRACAQHLGEGAWPACTPEYVDCVMEASAQREAPCDWACAAWGPFVPPGMEACA